jgi:ABC-type cobalamin/Fe3+-siderophores transport system ATPase subunit
MQRRYECAELVRSLEISVVVALHDLNLAATNCDQLVLLSAGPRVRSRTPDDVLSAGLIADGFGAKVESHRDPRSGRLQLWFHTPLHVDHSRCPWSRTVKPSCHQFVAITSFVQLVSLRGHD